MFGIGFDIKEVINTFWFFIILEVLRRMIIVFI